MQQAALHCRKDVKQVEFVTGPGMLYQALQVYHSVYPNLDGVTILDPGLIYPISWTEPKFGEALSHPSCEYHTFFCSHVMGSSAACLVQVG